MGNRRVRNDEHLPLKSGEQRHGVVPDGDFDFTVRAFLQEPEVAPGPCVASRKTPIIRRIRVYFADDLERAEVIRTVPVFGLSILVRRFV